MSLAAICRGIGSDFGTKKNSVILEPIVDGYKYSGKKLYYRADAALTSHSA